MSALGVRRILIRLCSARCREVAFGGDVRSLTWRAYETVSGTCTAFAICSVLSVSSQALVRSDSTSRLSGRRLVL